MTNHARTALRTAGETRPVASWLAEGFNPDYIQVQRRATHTSSLDDMQAPLRRVLGDMLDVVEEFPRGANAQVDGWASWIWDVVGAHDPRQAMNDLVSDLDRWATESGDEAERNAAARIIRLARRWDRDSCCEVM